MGDFFGVCGGGAVFCLHECAMKKFSVHPISVIIWIWLFFVFGILPALSYVLAIVIHELGHFLVARKLGYKLSKFSLSPYGFSLSYFDNNFDFRDEIKIALAGPFANLVSAFLFVGVWWMFPQTYFFTENFVSVSVVLALFNLLPAYPLDGGRIFVNVASAFCDRKIALRITMIFNILLFVIFLLLFVVFLFINFNPTYLLFACFLLVGMLDLSFGSKYEKVNIFCKKFKNFIRPVIFCVYGDVTLRQIIDKMQTSKTAIFLFTLESGKIVTLSEKMVINLSKNFDYNCKLQEIFEKM